MPLPVTDSDYRDDRAGIRWLGEPSARRSEYLEHYPAPQANGSAGVAINLRDADTARVEHRAATALASARCS